MGSNLGLYARRLVELVLVTFFSAAVPVALDADLSKAGVVAGVAAGLTALYGLVTKAFGSDKDKPGVTE